MTNKHKYVQASEGSEFQTEGTEKLKLSKGKACMHLSNRQQLRLVPEEKRMCRNVVTKKRVDVSRVIIQM